MGHGVVNPPRDVQKYLPASVDSENYGHYEDQKEIDLYEAMLHAGDLPTQRALMHDFEKSGLGGTLARQIAPDPKACCAAPDRVIHGYSALCDGEHVDGGTPSDLSRAGDDYPSDLRDAELGARLEPLIPGRRRVGNRTRLTCGGR